MAQPEIAVLVSSIRAPRPPPPCIGVDRCPRGIGNAIEVVVTDDGSRDETPRIVRQFAATVGFPVRFTTHPHDGFQLARCRNEGVLASTAPSLLFLDGDCMIPPDHLRAHLDRRRDGYVMAGSPSTSTNPSARKSAKPKCARRELPPAGILPEATRHVVATRSGHRLLTTWPSHSPEAPWRQHGHRPADYEQINGYDENFHGWGCENDELAHATTLRRRPRRLHRVVDEHLSSLAS